MIKNLIFDFGGVIYDINHQLSKLAFEKLGVSNFEQLYSHEIQDQLFEEFEKGRVSETEFRTAIRRYLNLDIKDLDLDRAWCALLIGVQKEKIDLLQELSRNYQLYLLSNTTSIHYRHFIEEVNAFGDFLSLFEGVYLSHETGMRKPDQEFYLKLINDHKLKAEECLFIDDLAVNIKAAQELGIPSYYLQNESILDLFKKGRWNF